MSIYICGACNCGKAEISRRIAAEYPSLRLTIDPADSVFIPIFGVGLDRIFRGRKWEGRTDETYQGIVQYLDLLEQEDIITNEGPLVFFSHLVFFGLLSSFNDEQRKEIITRCLDLLRKGKHFVVRRWADNGNFGQVSVMLQREFRNGRENIYTIPPATDYESTVEQAVEYIKGRMGVE
jgi:hypothetical protein